MILRGALIGIIAFSMALAQSGERRGPSRATLPSSLVGIVHAYPTQTSDSSICILGYRLDAADLVFFQRNQNPPVFVAHYIATIELRDSIGVVRFATVFHDSVTSTQPPQRSTPRPIANVRQTTLANRHYTINVDVTQQQRQRLFWQGDVTLDARAESVASASLIFLQTSDRTTAPCAELWGQTIPFGARNSSALVVVPRTWSGRDRLVALCRLRQQYYPFYRGTDTIVTVPITVDAEPTYALPLWSHDAGDASPQLCMTTRAVDQFRIIRMDVDLRRAIPGDYQLLLIRPVTKDTLTLSFRLQWFSPPPHLFVSRYAVEVMHYVLTDDEYTALLDTPDSNRTAAIIAWWAKQDPTPATRYNEAMVEYFRRAFAARTQFSTSQEPDGALSERGKIFILFGQPTRIETTLDPDKPGVEVWHYTNAVKKRFTFEITDQGRYRLVKIDTL